jgi:hypothetical protein
MFLWTKICFLSSAPRSQTPSVYVPPLLSETMLHFNKHNNHSLCPDMFIPFINHPNLLPLFFGTILGERY